MRCGIILLAAGAGKRFGGDKLKACVDGRPMYETAIARISALTEMAAVQKEDVVVVSGDKEILGIAHASGFRTVDNPAPMLGISRSIRLGLRALTSGTAGPASPCSMAAGLTSSVCEAVMFMVCDQPYLQAESVDGMLKAWQAEPSGILRAACDGRVGNPVIFHKDYFIELMSLYGDEGGRAVIAMHPETVKDYELSSQRELKDIDQRSDL